MPSPSTTRFPLARAAASSVVSSGLSATALFWLVARAFGSRRPARDAVVAVLLSVLVYQAFTRGLGLTLPSGVIERFL